MAKPLTPAKLKKLDAIAKDIAKSSKSTGKPVAVNQTPTFQAISKKGAKIQIARAFAKSVQAGEIEGIRIAGKTAANHTLYAAGRGPGRPPAAKGGAKPKGFFARLLGG